MEELKRINAGIVKKQLGRIGLGVGSLILGVVCIGRYAYQAGITAEQRYLSKEHPDVYEILTKRVLEEFDKMREQCRKE